MIKGAAREIILNTAERLFAEHGVNGVSLRSINAAAGVSPSVLHYHFGNREALLEALIERGMAPLMTERKNLLETLLTQEVPPITAVINALVDPLAAFVISSDEAGKRYVQFMARLYTERSDVFDQVSRRYMAEVTSHFPMLIARACPHLSPLDITWRLSAANNTMLYSLSELSQPLRHWQRTSRQDDSQPAPETVVKSLKQFIVGGFMLTESIS